MEQNARHYFDTWPSRLVYLEKINEYKSAPKNSKDTENFKW